MVVKTKPAGVTLKDSGLNREAWLTNVARQVEPLFEGYLLGAYRVTCGWPSANPLGHSRKNIGECHGPKSSKSGTAELFISPLLDEPLLVAGVLVHEMAHVAAGTEARHGRGFVAVCRRVGLLKGRPTQALPDQHLDRHLAKIIAAVGKYPHDAIVPVKTRVERARSSLSLACPECGCKVTMGCKWLAESGLPTCGCGTPFAVAEDGDE